MNTLVLLKMVPDIVEELEIDATGKALDAQFLRTILSEQDEHALEEALILKERLGGSVTVLAADIPGIDDALFTALAKGASKAVKLKHSVENPTTSALAELMGAVVPKLQYDLILTGTQAIDEYEGELGSMLAAKLNLSYMCGAIKLAPNAAQKSVEVVKELGGGLNGSYIMPMPSLICVQSAEKPPRYVPVAKIRQTMKTVKIESVVAAAPSEARKVSVLKLYKPEVGAGAVMLEGSPEEVAAKIIEIAKEKGALRR